VSLSLPWQFSPDFFPLVFYTFFDEFARNSSLPSLAPRVDMFVPIFFPSLPVHTPRDLFPDEYDDSTIKYWPSPRLHMSFFDLPP